MEEVKQHLARNGTSVDDLPTLAEYNVVLGRYLNLKTKPLNDATRIYRELRKNTKRSKHWLGSEIAEFKESLGQQLACTVEQIRFVVDVQKAKEAQKLEGVLNNAEVSLWQRRLDNDVIVFVQDIEDHFLKADLDSKKRQGMKDITTPTQNNKRIKQAQDHCISVITTTTVRTDTSSLSESTPTATPTQSTRIQISEPKPFQINIDSDTNTQKSNQLHLLNELEKQAQLVCQQWIKEEGPKGLEATLRKARLVQSFQEHIIRAKKQLMLQSNAFQTSPIPALRFLPAQQFALVLNTLGNSMLQWYKLYPNTCLDGEANAWTGNSLKLGQTDTAIIEEQAPIWYSDADIDMDGNSIGTYSSLELDVPTTLPTDDGVSDIVQCFEEFSMGSGSTNTRLASVAPRGEWSPVVREQEEHNSNTHPQKGKPQLPPRWNKPRPLFSSSSSFSQKRQPGHQFLQKQLKRFRNKKPSKQKNKIVLPTPASSLVRVRNKEELTLLYRRLRHNDPLLKEAVVDFDIAQQEAKELIRLLGLSYYDWDMRRQNLGDNNTTAFIVLKRSESSDWEEGSKD